MFDFHITCTKNIKTLNIVFDDGEFSVTGNEPIIENKKVENSGTFDIMDRLSAKADNPKKRVKKELVPEIINVDRPVKIATELNNLEF